MDVAVQDDNRETIVVVGNGMVGQRFCERLVEFDIEGRYRLVAFCEEPRAAYDRVGLTQFFAHRDAEKLMLAKIEWYENSGVELHIGDRVESIDRGRRTARSGKGKEISYDHLVLATGSYPFVPPVPGIEKVGVFVYRTITDLERLIAYSKNVKSAAVIGGGLLGLEAAKASHELGLETHVVEFAPRLMPRQIDDAGSDVLMAQIEALGVRVHLNKATREVVGGARVEGLAFEDGETLECQMIIVSAGIRPRDDLARESGVELGERGGVLVDDRLLTSDPHIYAIGEIAVHGGVIYGLVAPGYQMAETVAANLTGDERRFSGADLSTKLKLLGVDVASFGDHEAPAERATAATYNDPLGGVYKKLLFERDGSRLLGGIMVGDASDYPMLSMLCSSGDAVPDGDPAALLVGSLAGSSALPTQGLAAMPDIAQICSCNGVTKGAICSAIRNGQLDSVAQVKSITKAGSGCGGCVPLVSGLLAIELSAAGKVVDDTLCEHFPYSRQDLFAVIRVKKITSFEGVISHYGSGSGCEICKPVIASILASLWNESVVDHATLQDTNDRFLANIQRGGVYSVVPRVPGGEITPEKLTVLGRVAKKYDLYTKITGGQRIDLFGAPVHQLPDIWEELVDAGFESGHAYGKAVRTVKSCVGSTWCRYGVGDSVGFAIRVEQRYRGIRSPHKIKAAVSGCVRECAEAQSKDFGLIASESGYNLYVCGNGGANPRHADLLAGDLDEDTCIKYIDRFLMYYIQTADKLTRTAVWIDKLEGGIEHLREVIIDDSLDICAELEKQMQFLVDSYRCEWKEVVDDPQKRKLFRQFVNTDDTEADIEFVAERGQRQPVAAMATTMPEPRTGRASENVDAYEDSHWVKVGKVSDFPIDGGSCIKHAGRQVAVFNFASRSQWYAIENRCPHMNASVLSRGIIGDTGGEPKVACPLHKRNFSLASGKCLGDETYAVGVFPVSVDGDEVSVRLPLQEAFAENLTGAVQCHRRADGRLEA